MKGQIRGGLASSADVDERYVQKQRGTRPPEDPQISET
jgi:hypothetical protein